MATRVEGRVGSPRDQVWPDELEMALEHLVHHLNRLAYEIASSELSDPNDPTDSERWLYGRADEVETVVRDIIRDWRAAFISELEARTAMVRYLDIVHAGFASAFDLPSPGCCAAASENKVTATHDSMTRVAIAPSLPRSRRLLSRVFAFTQASFSNQSTPTPNNA